MPAISSSAPGKIILLGEHAVVYGRPAIAIPVTQVKARAVVLARPAAARGEIIIHAPDIGLRSAMKDLPENDPLAAAVRVTQETLALSYLPAFELTITSTIPIAAGLGSGAAISVAIIRAVAEFLGRPLTEEQLSNAAYQIEKIHHGAPSGIDNTVIAYQKPIYFIKGQPFETLNPSQSFTFVIADSGIQSPTLNTVADVRAQHHSNPAYYDRLFDAIAELVIQARHEITHSTGSPANLGALMDGDQALLQKMGVSCPELDRLVAAAKLAGAFGAKLCGGGRGGNMIALVNAGQCEFVRQALREGGAVQTYITELKQGS